MGLFDKIKEAKVQRDLEKQNRAIEAKFNTDLANWEASRNVAQKMLSAFQKIDESQDAVENTAVMKKGEFSFWIGQATFHESRRQPGTYVGRSSGISIPIGHTGMRYRTGAMKGTYIPGDDVQTNLDRGTILMTTQRLIFNGNLKTQEWAFAKWTGADTSENEMDYLFHVSNRQKASGISFSDYVMGQEFNRFLGAVLRIERDGVPALVKSLQEGLAELENNKPIHPEGITS